MNYRVWELKDIENLKELLDKDIPIDEIQEKLDRSKLSILNQIEKVKMGTEKRTVMINEEDEIPITKPKLRKAKIEKAAINFLDMRLKDKDYSSVWSSILDFQEVLEDKSIEQTEAHLNIKTKKWVGIAFVGDLHIGNMACDYKTMLQHRDLIAKTDNLYVALNGDYCDNYLPSSHAAGMFEALFPPAVQKNLAKDYIESIKDKVLALISGCHDIFSTRASDFDLTEYLAKHSRAVYLGNGGTLYLTVGKVTYKIMMRHKYKYNSAENPTSTVKKMFEKLGGFDLGVVSHNHIAAIEESIKTGLDGSLKRLFIRAGTYKVHDRYGKQQGFEKGMIGAPVAILNPSTREMKGFQDLQEGISYLSYLNGDK
jgi:hypothetical protein